MKISRKEDYAVLLMSALAHTPDGAWLSLDSVAKRYHLPLPFLHHIARDLKQAQLLKSREGVKGGYALTRTPKEIALAQILEATGGKLQLTQCTTDTRCPIERHCSTRQPWQKLHDVVYKTFASITLEELQQSA